MPRGGDRAYTPTSTRHLMRNTAVVRNASPSVPVGCAVRRSGLGWGTATRRLGLQPIALGTSIYLLSKILFLQGQGGRKEFTTGCLWPKSPDTHNIASRFFNVRHSKARRLSARGGRLAPLYQAIPPEEIFSSRAPSAHRRQWCSSLLSGQHNDGSGHVRVARRLATLLTPSKFSFHVPQLADDATEEEGAI